MAGKWFVQDSEPVAAGLFDIWVKTNEEAWIKTAAGWRVWGNFGSPDFGHIPKRGGIATGAIDGAHGHAASHNTTMDGDATLNGDSVVTLGMLEDQIKSIRELITGIGGSSGSGSGVIPGTSTDGNTGYEYAFALQTKYCVTEQWTDFRMPEFRGDVPATVAQCRLYAGGEPSWAFMMAAWAYGESEEIISDPTKPGGWGINLGFPSGIALQRSKDTFSVKVHNQQINGNRIPGALVVGFCIARK